MTPRLALAHHEAGHAVAAMVYGSPGTMRVGMTEGEVDATVAGERANRAYTYAGPIAHYVAWHGWPEAPDGMNLDPFISDSDRSGIGDPATTTGERDEAFALVRRYWPAVTALAWAYLHRVLSAPDADADIVIRFPDDCPDVARIMREIS